MTTFIVMLYLFLNITGRLSVALFGLTYNLVDDFVTEYPTLTTYWNSSVLVTKNATDLEMVEVGTGKNSTFSKITSGSQQLWLTLHAESESYLDLVQSGLTAFSYGPDIRFNISEPTTLSSMTHLGLKILHSNNKETDGNVSFEYYLPDFTGERQLRERSNHGVHTSARCTMLRLDGDKYLREYTSENQTSKGMLQILWLNTNRRC